MEKMELRQKKREVADIWQSEFYSLCSPFSEDITRQLLDLCDRVEDLPVRKADGVGKNNILVSHQTMAHLSTDDQSALAASIRRVFVNEGIKIPKGMCNVKKNDGNPYTTSRTTTFADIYAASADTPLIVCCCAKFQKLLQFPKILPTKQTPTDVLSFGSTYSSLHTDIGGTSRDQVIVNSDSYKIHIIAKLRSQKYQAFMKEQIASWTRTDRSVDIVAEIKWIIDNKHDFKFLFQAPFEQIQHCGANYHCVPTLTMEKQGITLSLGYREGHFDGASNYLKADPVKGYQKGAVIVPVETEQEEKVRNLCNLFVVLIYANISLFLYFS